MNVVKVLFNWPLLTMAIGDDQLLSLVHLLSFCHFSTLQSKREAWGWMTAGLACSKFELLTQT